MNIEIFKKPFIKDLLIFLLWILCVLVSIDLVGGLMESALSSAIFIIPIIGSFLIMIMGIMDKIFRKPSKKFKKSLPIFLFLISQQCASSFVSDYQASKTKDIGEGLVKTIYDYKLKYGHFPAKIEDLNLEYHKEIPNTTMGILGRHKFNYQKSWNKDSFFISFYVSMGYIWSYSSDGSGDWVIHD